MKLRKTAQEVANYLSGVVEGDPGVILDRVEGIQSGGEGALSFLSNSAYEHFLYETKCSAVLVDNDFCPSGAVRTTLIRVPNAYTALAQLLQLKKEAERPTPGIAEHAYVADDAQIDATATVGTMAYVGRRCRVGARTIVYGHAHIGDDVTIGDDCIVYPMAVLCADTSVGDRCIIHSGAVIGADGFGFAPSESGYSKIPQTGRVVLEDDVEVGANACIDRAVLDATIIRRGVKIDNLVQIGHNSEVKNHTVIAAQSGIAGSVTIGAWNTLAGQVGVAGHLTTADHTTLAAQTGVISNIKEPGIYFGSPAQPHLRAMKASAKFINLPEIDREVYRLRKDVEALRAELDDLRGKSTE